MSTISASTTSTTGFKVTSDTTGTLVFQTGASPTTAMSISSSQIISFTNPPTATGGGSVSTNSAYGTSALAANTTGAYNTAIGYQSAINNLGGSGNTALGAAAMLANTSGSENTALGGSSATYAALRFNTSGSYNVAVGAGSLASNTTASNNTAVGYQAGYSNTTGIESTFIGYKAGYGHNGSTGVNTCVGAYAGLSLTSGNNNTFVGSSVSGYYVTSGSKNTIIGAYNGNQGGLDIRTASNNIVLSDGDGNPRAAFMSTGTNSSWVFTNTDVTNKINAAETVQIIGVTSTGTDYCSFFNCQTGTTAYAARMFSRNSSAVVGSITFTGSATAYNTSSDYRLKDVTGPLTGSGEFIDALQPKVGTWKFDGSRFVGFIAHEVQEVSPTSVIGEKDAVDENGNPVHQAMEYGSAEFIANIVAELQSLRQRVAQLENQA